MYLQHLQNYTTLKFVYKQIYDSLSLGIIIKLVQSDLQYYILHIIYYILHNITIYYIISPPTQTVKAMRMTPAVAVIALINGMIGSTILVLPVLAKTTGTFLTLITILFSGLFSFYSCYLYVQHLGQHTDMDKAVYFHFWQSRVVQTFYNVIVFVNIEFVLIAYFLLIVQQWNGLLNLNVNGGLDILNPIINGICLFVLILLLKYIRFGPHLLGYGVVSITAYTIFLIWILIQAPSGDNKIPAIGTQSANLAAAMGQAFSIQQFFIPVLRQLPINQSKNYLKFIIITYIVGVVVYLYIAFMGSFGILNRSIFSPPAETIQDYFQEGQWQVRVIEGIYLIHLYSAYGQFVLVSKKRFFGILNVLFGTKNTREGEFFSAAQICFVVITIGAGLGVQFGNLLIDNIIEINGAVVGFFFIYLIPALLQFKCLYFARPKIVFQVVFRTSNIQEKYFENSNSKELTQTKRDVRKMSDLQSIKSIQDEDEKKQYKIQIKNENDSKYRDSLHQNLNINNSYQTKSPDLLTKKQPQVQLSQIDPQQSKPRKMSILNLQSPTPLSTPVSPQPQPQPHISQSSKLQQQLLPAADRSIIMSAMGQQKQQMEVQKINYSCQCKLPEGPWKVLDILLIFGMLAMGFFVMVYGIINVNN